jgi:hypothetical protein
MEAQEERSVNDRIVRTAGVAAVSLALALLLTACNFPLAQPTQDLQATAAAQTVSAQLTQAFAVTPTVPVVPPSETPVPPTLPPPTATLPPAPTATLGCTDNVTFVADVTIPDNTNMSPGESFDKTWRLRNSGTCTWNSEYDLVFVDGAIMGGPASKPLTGAVAPGNTVDLTVDLTAPGSNGTHRGNWRLRNNRDVLFGLTFYVQIVVGPTSTPAPEVYEAEQMTVNSSFNFDLDEGDSTASDATKDALYYKVSDAEQYIDPQNGAEFKKWGGSAPSYNDCNSASLSGNDISFADLPVGTWVCYETNEGRIGRFEVEGKTTSTITIDFRTWED